jgi:TatD DNase family protein
MERAVIDTHTHLQWPDFDKDREEVIKRAFAAGVQAIVSIGYDVNASRQAVQIAEGHDRIYAAVGIHPYNARTVDAESLEALRGLAQNRKVVAIGEIGLDYHRDLSPRVKQKEAFEKQFALARELRLPVVIHDREAHADVLQLMCSFASSVAGVMHCFSGNIELAKQAIEQGYLISLAGPVTFPNAKNLHRVAQWLPEESIVLETDCPWLAPQSMRGKRNEPAFVLETAHKVAELKSIRVEELIQITSQNAKQLFRIP